MWIISQFYKRGKDFDKRSFCNHFFLDHFLCFYMTWFYCSIMTHWFPFLCLPSSWRETWGINFLGNPRFPFYQWGAKIFRNIQSNKERQRKVFWERKDSQRKTSTSLWVSGGCGPFSYWSYLIHLGSLGPSLPIGSLLKRSSTSLFSSAI